MMSRTAPPKPRRSPRRLMDSQIRDKRQDIRLHFDLSVRVSTVAARQVEDGESYFAILWARSVDMSENGISLRCTEPLAAGERVMIELYDEEGEILRERMGRVAWSSRAETGRPEVILGVELEPTDDPITQRLWQNLRVESRRPRLVR